uniref:dTDP-4-dehydrorhamnose reductase n=1 Tax=Roseihalotalea indica TaxID=2867963 RepID=A0AA49GIC4_9BACT|nr:SDR family oxidoreductase [Tunicatimonas sp. TK19036]
MYKILVTGANGLLGQKLTAYLATEKEIQVVATSRGCSRFELPDNVEYIPIDITQCNQMMTTLNQVKPDIIIHTAATTNVDYCEQHQDECWETNVQGVAHIVQGAKHCKSFLIHISTDFVFDGEETPLPEDANLNPVNFYGQSKVQAERLIQQSDIRYAILRTAVVYGVASNLSRTNFVLWVKDCLESKKKIQVVDDQYRTPTLADDLAMACYLVSLHRAQGIFHISGSEVLTPYQMALIVAKVFGLDEKLIERSDSSNFNQVAKRPMKTGLSIDKAWKEFAFMPCSFYEGVMLIEQQMTQSPIDEQHIMRIN